MKHVRDLFQARTPVLRSPEGADGADIWELVRACKPLDENSMYCNLLQCDHFRDTCVVAELDGEIAGWVSAYRRPDDPQTLFVWQVAVSPVARGCGLGRKMLNHLMDRRACKGVSRLQTTITADNDASWALFRRFAESHGAEVEVQAHFTHALHFRERHATEHMMTIRFEEQVRKAA